MASVSSFSAIPSYVRNGCVPNFKLTPDQIRKIGSEYIDGSTSVYNTIAALPNPTFSNCIGLIAAYDNSTREAVGVIGFLRYVSTDKAVRAASTIAVDAMNKHGGEMFIRKDVYRSISAVYNCKEEMSRLQAEDKMLVEKLMETLRSYGHELSQEMFDNLNRITDRLDKLISQHSQNAIEITNRVYFTREELDGLPADYFEGRSAHIIDGIAKFIVTTKIPDYEPVMRFAKSAETRKQMFTAFSSRCHENIPLLQEAVDLRRKSAQILGYRSHAEFVLKRQMAETPDAVLAMLNKVRGAVAGSHKAKLDELAELKKKDMADKPYDGFFDWDLGYYGRVFAETACSYDLEEIRQYFPVKHVVGAILDIYQKMLGLQITRLDLAEPAWDSDVEMFEVREASDATKVVGYFYVDLYSREGKYNNAAQYPISDGYERPDGTRHLPVSALMANFPKPQGTANDQALLSHTSVQTLMHETGHVFHHLCARTKWCTLHYGQMERDFIEIPSKMLENWCWQPDVLRKISAHHNTGLPLSGDKIQRIVDMRHRIAQFGYMSTAFLALYDMTIHNSSSSVDVAQTYVAMSKNIVLSNQGDAELVPRLGSITHLMSGYDARYYSYLWSDIFGADIFSSRFIKEGLDNPQTGMDYRTEILQPGASRPAKLSIARFLGRNPSSTAFFRNIN